MIGGRKRTRVLALGLLLGTVLLSRLGAGQQGLSGCESAQKYTLENGLTVISDIDASSPTTILQILVKGGKRAEPAGKRGLSFLTTRLSVEIPDSSKIQELMSLATRFSATVQGDHSIIIIETLSENLEASLKVLSRIILDPLFSGLRIDAVKQHMEHQSQIEEDDSVRLGHLSCLGAFFAGSAYEGSIYGDRESLKAIKNRDISDFYKRCFIGSNMIMSISSDLPREMLLDLVARYFAKIPKGEPLFFDPVSASEPKDRAIHLDRDTKQTYICLAYPLPEASPRNFALASVLENILGKGPGSRLWPIRNEKKLAYNLNCRATQMQCGGIIEAYLETDQSKIESAKEILRQTILNLAEKGVGEEELVSAKTAAAADFVRDNEMKTGKVSSLAFFEAAGFGIEYFRDFLSELEGLSLDQTNAYIKSILTPGKGLEVVIGPKPMGK
jgi:zinc protease